MKIKGLNLWKVKISFEGGKTHLWILTQKQDIVDASTKARVYLTAKAAQILFPKASIDTIKDCGTIDA